MTIDADAIIWLYAPSCIILERAGLTKLFLIPKENLQEKSMPNRKAIHETPREIPGTSPTGARSQAVFRPRRGGESDWFAYKGRPAARPTPPPKAPAPPPKQKPAPAPGAPKPAAPAKEADAGQK
jgi:hypothetical protein